MKCNCWSLSNYLRVAWVPSAEVGQIGETIELRKLVLVADVLGKLQLYCIHAEETFGESINAAFLVPIRP